MCLQVALQQSATDPSTGQIDMDCINIGTTSSDRRAQELLGQELRQLLESKHFLHASAYSQTCSFGLLLGLDARVESTDLITCWQTPCKNTSSEQNVL